MKNVTLLFVILAASIVLQAEADPIVVPLHLEKIRTLELDSIPPWPEGTVIKGTNQHWQKELHRGEVAVAIYEAMPAVIDVSEPFPYDEFVVVLEGEVTLTDIDGSAQTYRVGDSFTVPKGWRGTWDMPVKYREMIVVETNAWEASGE
ncbi:MAG: cupin domain-containing protein [bacterium]